MAFFFGVHAPLVLSNRFFMVRKIVSLNLSPSATAVTEEQAVPVLCSLPGLTPLLTGLCRGEDGKSTRECIVHVDVTLRDVV